MITGDFSINSKINQTICLGGHMALIRGYYVPPSVAVTEGVQNVNKLEQGPECK